MRSFLTKSSTLWVLGILMILNTLAFGVVMRWYDFHLIDEMREPDKIRAHIAAFSEQQKQVHIWVTAKLDVTYPLVYGGLFVGLVWRFLGPPGRLLALPGLAVIPIDLTEGVIQIMALSGNDAVVDHKAWVTPIKLGLFVLAAIFAIVAIAVALRRRFFSPKVA